MVKQITTNFEEIKTLLHYVTESIEENNKVAILGGHFLIDYYAEKQSLEPLIVEDIVNENFKIVAQLETGEFPYCSFKHSISLHEELSRKNVVSKIILLVNDHKTSYLSANRKKDLLPNLRKDYYKKNQIPASYLKLLKEKNIQEKDILLHNFENKSSVNTADYLFSENHFRKKFDKSLKSKILNTPGFYSIAGNSGKRDVYVEGVCGEDYCLSDDGACGCSGEVMQLIFTIVQKENYDNIVLFIPYECSIGVNNGAYAILRYLSELNIKVNVNVITNLPCDNNYKNSSNPKISIVEYKN